jgi:D-3-phosphoglycerate dehydrogenase
MTEVVVLDSLFDELDVEREAARTRDADLVRWDGELASLANAEAVLHVRTRVDAALIAAMPRCRAIGRFGSGVDTVDVDAARRAAIEVVVVRDYCIPELPTHTLALAFALQRRLFEIAGSTVSWNDVARDTPLRRRACVAVVGLGSVGSRIATAMQALGYRVLAVTRTAELAAAVGLASTPLDEALGEADLIFLQTSLDESTRGLLSTERVARLKRDAVVVNTARLALIDEDAMATALHEHRVGGLALDAALPADSPLIEFRDDPRVLVSPHVGWYSEEAAAELRARAVISTLDALNATREGT